MEQSYATSLFRQHITMSLRNCWILSSGCKWSSGVAALKVARSLFESSVYFRNVPDADIARRYSLDPNPTPSSS
jgi:hypothetical protein